MGRVYSLWGGHYPMPPPKLGPEQVESACARSPAVWAWLKRGLVPGQCGDLHGQNPDELRSYHVELYDLLRTVLRLCVVAPRDSGKSETLASYGAWRLIFDPVVWVHIFSATELLASMLKRRIDQAVVETRPDLMPRRGSSDLRTDFANGSRLSAASAGSASRGIHPDVIINDDVLDEAHAYSGTTRRKFHDWALGSMLPMAHPGGTVRTVKGKRREFGAAQVVVVGTPFHGADLLLGDLRRNEIWTWRRYSMEFDVDDLVTPPSPCVQLGEAGADRLLPRDERTVSERLHDHGVVTAAKERVAAQRLGMSTPHGGRPFGDPDAPVPDGPPPPRTRPRVRLHDTPWWTDLT
jgi:hypothetical protein